MVMHNLEGILDAVKVSETDKCRWDSNAHISRLNIPIALRAIDNDSVTGTQSTIVCPPIDDKRYLAT